ncbi:MAG: hypothetical protein RBQ77_03360 [Candidatus Methanomethylophilaceae archaeon]|nr:hypothetical protein [Candidatus Methanomethylophilaceae archaeon]
MGYGNLGDDSASNEKGILKGLRLFGKKGPQQPSPPSRRGAAETEGRGASAVAKDGIPGADRMVAPSWRASSSAAVAGFDRNGFVRYNVAEEDDVFLRTESDRAVPEEEGPALRKAVPNRFAVAEEPPVREGPEIKLASPSEARAFVAIKPCDMFLNALDVEPVDEDEFNRIFIKPAKSDEEFDEEIRFESDGFVTPEGPGSVIGGVDFAKTSTEAEGFPAHAVAYQAGIPEPPAEDGGMLPRTEAQAGTIRDAEADAEASSQRDARTELGYERSDIPMFSEGAYLQEDPESVAEALLIRVSEPVSISEESEEQEEDVSECGSESGESVLIIPIDLIDPASDEREQTLSLSCETEALIPIPVEFGETSAEEFAAESVPEPPAFIDISALLETENVPDAAFACEVPVVSEECQPSQSEQSAASSSEEEATIESILGEAASEPLAVELPAPEGAIALPSPEEEEETAVSGAPSFIDISGLMHTGEEPAEASPYPEPPMFIDISALLEPVLEAAGDPAEGAVEASSDQGGPDDADIPAAPRFIDISALLEPVLEAAGDPAEGAVEASSDQGGPDDAEIPAAPRFIDISALLVPMEATGYEPATEAMAVSGSDFVLEDPSYAQPEAALTSSAAAAETMSDRGAVCSEDPYDEMYDFLPPARTPVRREPRGNFRSELTTASVSGVLVDRTVSSVFDFDDVYSGETVLPEGAVICMDDEVSGVMMLAVPGLEGDVAESESVLPEPQEMPLPDDGLDAPPEPVRPEPEAARGSTVAFAFAGRTAIPGGSGIRFSIGTP